MGAGLRLLAAALATVALTAGCARDIGGSSVPSSQVGAATPVERGTVVAVREVSVQDGDQLTDNVVGGLIGAAAGAVIGSQIGGGFGRDVAIGAGGVAGAAAGAAAQRGLSRQTAQEYVVALRSGREVAIVQTDGEPIAVGAEVFVQGGGYGRGDGRARITPAAPSQG
jgi:outer membrane lipoprotein SlyB